MHPNCAKPAAYYNSRELYKIERSVIGPSWNRYKDNLWHAHVIQHDADRVTCLGRYSDDRDATEHARRHCRRIGLTLP